jgi:hypothetical protein
MIELKFNRPIEIYADNALDGKKFKFLYTIKYVKSGPEIDEEIEYKLVISVSNLLLKRWRCQNEDDLFKIFFYLAFKRVQNKLVEDALNEIEKMDLQTNTPDVNIKYDPKKIDDFVDKVYILDLDELKRNKNKFKMGF